MFIKVKLLSGFNKPLLYKIPVTLDISISVGSLVQVPIRKKFVSAIVIEIIKDKPLVNFTIKEITKIHVFSQDKEYFTFIKKLAYYYQVDYTCFLKRIQVFLKETHTKDTPKLITNNEKQEILLTSQQQSVTNYLEPFIKNNAFKPTVLHGVTGSGKTEVYKKLIQKAYLENKSSLLLLPEVSLAVQFEKQLIQMLPENVPIVSFHSATDAKTKKKLWENVIAKKPQLIIGVHLPVLLPISNLGIIIVDEEHESGYQEKKHPKVNSKEAAILKAQICNIPILLGSATPSIATLHSVKEKKWKFFQLTKRFSGNFPKLTFAKLQTKKKRAHFWLTEILLTEIKNQLQKKEQTILFLNRRGVSFFVQCKECSFIFSCISCSVSLTLHADDSLRCHYCNYKKPTPQKCTECNYTEFIKKGIGTQQLVTLLKKIIPEARVARADMDSTKNKILWSKTLQDFKDNNIDILVGTQTITKGYHFPNVTLVGVIWADLNLNFPQYNAQEKVLQQLIQVAGRAGRQHPESSVIIQSMSDHPVFNFIDEKRYLEFYQQEIMQRKEVQYPPCIRLAEVELKHKKEAIVDQEAELLAAHFYNHKDIITLGPVEPPIVKIKSIVSRKIFLKSASINSLIMAYQAINKAKLKSTVSFTPNPL